ncbi:hypothetical protein DPMN_092718 [Dreissena polymorpha]|uniref:Uncharacterized protein n=1 Tax=Dreissena polymorpha TaxID=45954 RepID=A0A9D4L2Z2_DREPO|nr:hypothetical protein DPMN_092718 [Dreissena polymorpha]
MSSTSSSSSNSIFDSPVRLGKRRASQRRASPSTSATESPIRPGIYRKLLKKLGGGPFLSILWTITGISTEAETCVLMLTLANQLKQH